jgi:hypothetical protein
MQMPYPERVARKLLPNVFRRYDILVALHKNTIEVVEKKMQEDLNG